MNPEFNHPAIKMLNRISATHLKNKFIAGELLNIEELHFLCDELDISLPVNYHQAYDISRSGYTHKTTDEVNLVPVIRQLEQKLL